MKRVCGGRDSNTRTPTRQGPQPCAFDLAGQPPHWGFFYYCALERSETHTWIEPCKVQLWQQPH